MAYVFIELVAEQFAGALVFFPLVWLGMRKKGGQKVVVGKWWLLRGIFATAIGAGAIRFVSVIVIGGNAALHPEGGWGIFFFLGLPILIATAICAFMRTKVNTA